MSAVRTAVLLVAAFVAGHLAGYALGYRDGFFSPRVRAVHKSPATSGLDDRRVGLMSEEEFRSKIDVAISVAIAGDADLDEVEDVLQEKIDRIEEIRLLRGDD